MASRYSSVSRPAFSLIKSTFTKPAAQAKASHFLLNSLSSKVNCSSGLCAVTATPTLCCVIGTPHFLSRHRFEELEIIDSGNGPWHTAISDLEDQQLKDLCQFILLGSLLLTILSFLDSSV